MRGPGILSMRLKIPGSAVAAGSQGSNYARRRIAGGAVAPGRGQEEETAEAGSIPLPPRPEPPLWPRIGCGLSRGPRARRNWRLFRCRPCVFTAAGARLWLQFILDVRGSTSSSGLEKNGVQGPGRQDAPHGHWAPHVVQRPLGLRDPYGSPGPCIPDRASSGKLRMNRAQGSVRNSGLFGAGVH